MTNSYETRWLAPSCFLLLLLAYHVIFGEFFPTRNGTLGHDYSRILPDLLDGYFWVKSNGLFEPFWFTPAFCGGQPALGAPDSGFYSVGQFMSFFADPLASVYATVLLFASLGFWGFYLLLLSCFGSSRQAAVLGGALFMFNGFFIHRMMIGHFSFHSVMLIPWVAYLLLRSTSKGILPNAFNGAAAGCMMAYVVYSGMVHLLFPCALAVIGIASVHGLSGRESPGFVPRSLFAVLVASALSAAKLTAALSFLHNFPRSDYTLPGLPSLWAALHLLFSALFFSPPDIADHARPLLVGVQWMLGRHEWEYGVTVVPLSIILVGTTLILYRISSERSLPRLNATRCVWIALTAFILGLPFALNVYTPDWNAFLKQVPVIKSSSNLLRWFLVYIPLVIVLSALFVDKISSLSSRRAGILLAGLLALILINARADRDYYHDQHYKPDVVVNAWRAARVSKVQVSIQNVGVFVDANQRIQMPLNRNDLIATGTSQLVCYNPIFGYRLEHFPVKGLHPGPILAETDGRLNIKNPACYTYPEQNNCSPGDHFIIAQEGAALAFASYKPFPFNFSSGQIIANRITLITLALLLVIIAAVLVKKIWRS